MAFCIFTENLNEKPPPGPLLDFLDRRLSTEGHGADVSPASACLY